MFTTRIDNIDSFPTQIKRKICIRNSGLDDTLAITATLLLYQRVDNLKLSYTLNNSFDGDILSLNPEVFSFHWFENVGTNPDELLKSCKSNFKTIEKLPTHEKFLSDQLKQPVFIRLMPTENTVCIFAEKITFPVWHCIQFFIPKFFRIFKEKPLTKEEIAFLETLTHKVSSNYITKATELANEDSFRSFVIKDQLEAFEKKLFEQKVHAAERNLQSLENEMQRAMEEYRKACEKRVEAIALVSGLKTMADQTDEHTDLQDYLLNNPRICCVSLSDSIISFIVKTYLAPHHIEEWEVMSKGNKIFGQYVQYGSKVFNNAENIKLLLDAILSENRCLKLRMCAYFEMDYFGSTVTSRSRYAYASKNKSLKDYIPNPHLYFHNCFGQNKLAIVEQLVSGDAIGAIECAIACTQRVNIAEGMSFKPFVEYLLSCKEKCLVTEDGKEMSPEEAVEYLKGKTNE